MLASAGAAARADEVDRASMMRRPTVSWTLAEREVGFAHWDELYPARVIARGASVRPLPQGPALAGFGLDGTESQLLQRVVDDLQLAGLVVLHRGQLRLERYAHGFGPGGRWLSFSIAKSLTSTLVGAAIQDGSIGSVDDAVTRYIPELKGSAYEGVTLRQLLSMSSGTQWNEDYGDPASDFALFYLTPFAPGTDPTVSYMKTLRRVAAPGRRWQYNTGETNLVGVVLSRATGKPLARFASEKIWAAYGMESDASWMFDRSGHEHGGCCVQATTRDFARFGQFILEGGRVDGRPVLPEDWLQAATRKQVDIGRPGSGYGYQWWTRDNGSFSAIGIHGQVVHVDPARGLVIALNSATAEASPSPASMQLRMALFDAIRAAIDAETTAALKPR